MTVLQIVLLVLIIYSAIATIVYCAMGENEEIIMAFGLGLVGLSLWCVVQGFRKLKNKFKHLVKRSIFEEKETGKKYTCKVKDTHNVEWVPGYKIIRRYATKNDWKDIPSFSKEFIENSKRNCDNCKYNDYCIYEYPRNTVKCKNEYGVIEEFNKFEPK